VLARPLGWHAIRLIHSRATFNKYEAILGIKFKEHFPEARIGCASRSGIWLLDKIGKFWQALSEV